jgi:hypothetical protein
MSFATLEEAWGVPVFGVSEVKPEMKQKETQRRVLERAESAQRSYTFVTNYIRDVYENHGIAAVMGLMNRRIVSELRKEALWSFEWLDANSMLFVFSCLCVLYLLADIFRRR